MLTEIEWWGGLLFIWMAGCYAMFYSTFNTGVKFRFDILLTHIAFISAGLVLALYFYPIQSNLWQYIYTGSIGFGVIASIIIAFLPDAEDSSDKEEEGEDAKDEDEEGGLEIVAQLILFFPLIASFTLGIYKAVDFFKTLPSSL
jgi:hypothetical protein